MKELYDQRLNILIHGITEATGAWQTPLQTLAHIHRFIKEGLLIEDPLAIALADYHKLP